MRYLLVPTDSTAETITLEVPEEIIPNKTVKKPKKSEKEQEAKKLNPPKRVQTSRSYGKTYHRNLKRSRSK